MQRERYYGHEPWRETINRNAKSSGTALWLGRLAGCILRQAGPGIGGDRRAPTDIFEGLYDSEINFEVSGFYDAGFDVRLGNHLNGFLVKGKVETWAEAETWLRDQALTHFPNSKFAQEELQEAQAH
jgi:hypothetical protein